jgi:hypothetical protein
MLPHNLFGYHCGIQAITKYSPFMVLIAYIPRSTTNNNLNGLCDVFDEDARLEVMAQSRWFTNVIDY